MKTFHTSVTDLRVRVGESVETFPYECGWADEAIFFVTVENDTDPRAAVSLRAQLSADGIRWLDDDATLELRGPSAGFLRVVHFGGFLRLAGTVAGDSDGATITVRLALKG